MHGEVILQDRNTGTGKSRFCGCQKPDTYRHEIPGIQKDGFATTFTITAYEPMERYEFDMENEKIQGHWIGTFEKITEAPGRISLKM